MPFDLKTAFEVKEREDGLLERAYFDLTSATPTEEIYQDMETREGKDALINTIISNKETTISPEEPPDPSLQSDWTLTKAVGFTWLTGGAYPVVAGLRGVLDKKKDETLAEGLYKGILSPETTKSIYEHAHIEGANLPPWAKFTADLAENILLYSLAGVSKSFAKQALYKRAAQRTLRKAAIEKVKELKMLPAGAKAEEKLIQDAEMVILRKWQAIETTTAAEGTLGKMGTAINKSALQQSYERTKILGLLADEVKSLSNVGAIMPKPGQTVSFTGEAGKILSGVIQSIEGQRVIIDMAGKAIVATLSQLTIPPPKPVAPKGEGEILGKSYAELKQISDSEEVTVYRASEKGGEIKTGDWVTTDKEVAKFYMRDIIGQRGVKEAKIVSAKVKAGDIRLKKSQQDIGVENQFILSQPKGEVAEVKPEKQVIKATDIPPEEPPKFPGVSKEFLEQPKPKTTILQYFTPAEYHLKQLGFDAKIGQPVREALKDFSIELMNKNKKLIKTQKEHYAKIPKNEIKKSKETLWRYMDKGIPQGKENSIEGKIATQLRVETKEMLKRMNELNQRIGKEEIREVKNYILHMLQPEILNEIYATGVIPPELAKVMEYIPTKNVFLRTAQHREGVPEKWLVKDPYELMKAMYAIDLRYIHLQDALAKIDPYLKAVKGYVGEKGEYWPPETYKYLDDWIKQAIKMRPSNWDTLIDNMLEHTFAPLLRKTGLKISHMPWRDLISTLSAAAHTGALGMRLKPLLRNLVQSTFDWVMYGTKPYLKGSAKFLTKEGHKILKQSKTWQTRMPFEAQDLATLQKVFKAGSIGYRFSDLHNVGRGLLTRYYHAIDDLKMTHEEAIKWMDEDLPATQWSYRREDLPRAYWTTTGRAFWTLGSWWMNFYNRFLPELIRRAFTGKDVTGRVIPTSERLGIMRLFVLIGILFGVKEASKELTGTTVDYTGQVRPTPLRDSPIASIGNAFVNIAQGIIDEDNRSLKEGIRGLSGTGKIFIPFYLAGQDMFNVLTGKKEFKEILFYQGRKKAIKGRKSSTTRKRSSRTSKKRSSSTKRR